MQFDQLKRREFISWSAAQEDGHWRRTAQQPPVIGFLSARSPGNS
jgi:hypothetical protein